LFKFSIQILFLRYAQKKEPAMDIAGLCLPLKPQKERRLSNYIVKYKLLSGLIDQLSK
jgi:hypothetical protein